MFKKIKDLFKNKSFLALLGIMILAIFFRFYQLGSLPPGLHPDEAANGLDIIRCLDHGQCSVFYSTNGPREAFFFYIQMIGVFLFGYSQISLRIGAAIVSVLTILATYFLGKELFTKRVGLLSAFSLAVIPWYLVVSRDGFRANLTPLLVVTMLYFGIRAYRSRKILDFALFGASLGLGFHSYLAFRLFPLTFIVLGIFILIFRRDIFSKILSFKKGAVVSTFSFGIVLLPLVLYFIKHPEDIGARAAGTSILNKDLNGGHPLTFFLQNLEKTALMFNYRGDANFRQNLGGAPMLDPLGGIAFLIGFFYSFWKIIKWQYFLVLATFGVMLLPMVLTAEGIPHGLRSIGIAPMVAIMAALGINFIWERWEKDFKNKTVKTLGIITLSAFIVFSISYNYIRYFGVYANTTEAHEAYAEDMVTFASRINKAQPHIHNIAVIGQYSDKTVNFLTHQQGIYKQIEPKDIDNFNFEKGISDIYIGRDMINDSEPKIKSIFPDAKQQIINSSFDGRPLLYFYEVKKD